VFATILELGLLYPNAILRYSGFRTYYLGEFILASVGLIAVIMTGLFVSKSIRNMTSINKPTTSVKPPINTVIDVISNIAMRIFFSLTSLQTYQSFEGSTLSSVMGAVFFILMSTLAVMCYYGRDLGLGFLEDNLEYIILITVLSYIAISIFSKERLSLTINPKGVIVAFVIPILLASLVAVSLYNISPTYENPKDEIKVWSYNVHFGFTPDGAFNGYELIKLLKNEAPDIIAMQEVMGGSIESAYQDVPVMISAFTGMA